MTMYPTTRSHVRQSVMDLQNACHEVREGVSSVGDPILSDCKRDSASALSLIENFLVFDGKSRRMK
jgi:hypothetical protein